MSKKCKGIGTNLALQFCDIRSSKSVFVHLIFTSLMKERHVMCKTAMMLVSALVGLSLMFVPSSVSAQTGGGTFGTILGVVNDEIGAVVPKVTVTATNEKTGVARSGVTNSEGSYQIPALLPGTYRVDAETSGFKKYQQAGVI